MSNVKTISIDGVNYVRADSTMQSDETIKIVVVDKGFVYIGNASWSQKGDMLQVTDAKNIRIWGTSKGLGELASGPTSKTVLDNVGTIHVPLHAVIHLIDVNKGAWKIV